VDDCRHDLSAWIDWLVQRAGPRVGLLGTQPRRGQVPVRAGAGAQSCGWGHGRGFAAAVIVLVVQRQRPSAGVLGTFEQARQLVSIGEPNHLLDVRLPLPFVVTAAGYVEKYGPDERL